MATVNRQVCPHCGQTINKREIALFSGMVKALFKVWQWCEEKGVHEFQRKDIKHLFKTENEVARFGDWVWFGGIVYKNGKGHYGFNVERIKKFFAGQLEIPVRIYKDPLSDEIIKSDYRTIKGIPHLVEFLDENNEFIARYGGFFPDSPAPKECGQ
jgi:hypothetical protein